jgi:hypothetical protein
MVRFNVVDEFLDELTEDLARIERKIVRITNMYQQSATHPVIQHLSVVATCKIAGEIVRLEVNAGAVMRLDSDKQTYERVEKAQNRIKTFCREHHLSVRAGIYE